MLPSTRPQASPVPSPASRPTRRGARALSGALSALVASRARRARLADRDPRFIRLTLPVVWPVLSAWFRPEVRGLERIPADRPVLVVGNHSGGNVAPDTLVFTLAFVRHFGASRPFYQLAHDLVTAYPGLAQALRRWGTIAANWDNAAAALDAGAAVLVYPGGDWEVHRPVWQGHRVDFHGRAGFVRLALTKRVPIVPVVSIGGQETALFLTRGERLARLTALDRLFRLHVLPISIAPPWGVNVGDLLGHVPLPAKITTQVLEPIDLAERYGRDPDVDVIFAELIALMQRALNDLAADRRWPLVG